MPVMILYLEYWATETQRCAQHELLLCAVTQAHFMEFDNMFTFSSRELMVFYEYHARSACLLRQTICRAIFQLLQSAALRVPAPLMRRGNSQMAPGLGSTAGAEGCSSKRFKVFFTGFAE
ncbi:hypothetical protein TNCV_1011481 [Trichonephila clavipes]|uniref:Uncharacterized protein n=1 Tax=Trichonephila clavipes TaxID=2585209 RepID=A0A8X6VX50_TRICX|nr:hypothetical protein TNCV_1011481 [Trichonephila clavipes]